jgi:hypothetical protein
MPLRNPPKNTEYLGGRPAADYALRVTQQDEFTATAAQTAFPLSKQYAAQSLSVVTVNSVAYAEGLDYTISTTQVTWLNNDFIMEAGDRLVVKYQITNP